MHNNPHLTDWGMCICDCPDCLELDNSLPNGNECICPDCETHAVDWGML
jgi:hypothetical protein